MRAEKRAAGINLPLWIELDFNSRIMIDHIGWRLSYEAFARFPIMASGIGSSFL